MFVWVFEADSRICRSLLSLMRKPFKGKHKLKETICFHGGGCTRCIRWVYKVGGQDAQYLRSYPGVVISQTDNFQQ